MKIVVLKFGGTSVGTIGRIKKVADIIAYYIKKKYKVIVVSSAMSGTTNDLVKKSKNISNNFSSEEYDALVSSGEQVACALIAGRLIHKGYKSRSWMGWQIPIITDDKHKYSKINQIYKNKIIKYLKSGGIPIVTGFQGINRKGRITTIGRGGSDASAIMLAKFFKAERCIIYTDVEGIYTTDPRKLEQAKKIRIISYEEMLEMASLGAKVMQPVSIQDARLNRIDIEVKSSFKNKSGTLITKRKNIINRNIITGISSTQNDAKVMQPHSIQDARLNRIDIDVRSSFKKASGTLITKRKNILSNKIIRGVSFTKNDAKITLVGIKDRPGVAASIFEPLYINSINVDMVVQNISSIGRETDLTFTIKSDDSAKT